MANLKEAFDYASKNPTSEFANNLKQLASSGSLDQEAIKYGIDLAPFKPKPEDKTLPTKLKETGKKTLDNVIANTKDMFAGKKDVASTVLQDAGAIAEGATDALGNIITSTPIVKDVVETVAPVVSSGVKALQAWLQDNPVFQKIVTGDVADKIAKVLDEHPEIKNNAEAIDNIANAVLIGKGGVEGAGKIALGAKEGTEAVVKTAKDATKATMETVAPIVKPATDLISIAGEGMKRIPAKIATNMAEKQAQEALIKSLPTKTAQDAVRDGIDITDVKTLSEFKPTSQSNKLIQTVKDFASGNTKVDPIEVVGAPIVQRIKELKKMGDVVGSKLGEVAKNLGVVTKPELQGGVISRLQSVPGLQEIKLNAKGLLDFSKTTLATTLSKADRNAIQEAFTQATKWGDGAKAHRFRQTLFETLGGKKKSLQNITDTQERAFNAIRSGLSDVLETKNPAYKTLSNEYRKIVQPLGDMRKLMKNVAPDADEDILNMSAGLLARRITSASISNPQVKSILKALDEAGVKGTTKESVENLQDLYNILNKYYDIAPKTGFQNLVKEGTSVPKGLYDAISGAVKDLAGNTNAVRQKGLERLLEELSSSVSGKK